MREDFGERSIRTTKHKITHAATRDAAKASADCCVLEMCMRRQKRQHPDIDAPLQRLRDSKRRRRTDTGGVDGVQLHQLRDAYTGEENDVVRLRLQCIHLPILTMLRRYIDRARASDLRRMVPVPMY